VQPGIETFNSHVLRLMNKGVRAMHNVYALCTLMRHGVYPAYNLIFGFPGEAEAPDEFHAMLRLLPSLSHLVPPDALMPVLTPRYAPISEMPQRYGAAAPLTGHWRYDVVFSSSFLQQHRLGTEDFCYYFDNPYRDFDDRTAVMYGLFQHQYVAWMRKYKRGTIELSFRDDGECMLVSDNRFDDCETVLKFGAIHCRVRDQLLQRCWSEKVLIDAMAAEAGASQCEIRDVLDEFRAARLLAEEEGWIVWLPLPKICYETPSWRARVLKGCVMRNHSVRPSSAWRPRTGV